MRKFYRFARALVWPFTSLIYPYKVINREKADIDGGFIIAANHLSNLDPFFLAYSLRKRMIHFMAKEEILKNGFLRLIAKISQIVPVNRGTADLKAMRACMNVIKEGGNVGIFPQGTRTPEDPKPESALPGTGLIILHTKAPVLPVSIITKNHKVRLFKKCTVVIGEPILYEEYSTAGNSGEAAKYCFKKVCERFE